MAEFNILMVQRWNIYMLLAGTRSGVSTEGKVRLEMSPSIHLYLSISIPIHVLGTQQQQGYDRHNGERLNERFPLFGLHGVFMTRFCRLTSKR